MVRCLKPNVERDVLEVLEGKIIKYVAEVLHISDMYYDLGLYLGVHYTPNGIPYNTVLRCDGDRLSIDFHLSNLSNNVFYCLGFLNLNDTNSLEPDVICNFYNNIIMCKYYISRINVIL